MQAGRLRKQSSERGRQAASRCGQEQLHGEVHEGCLERPGVVQGCPRARSLRLLQRIIIGFIKALYFAAVEALIPDFKPRPEGFGRAQVLNGVTERLSRCLETAILGAATPRALPRTVQPGRCSRRNPKAEPPKPVGILLHRGPARKAVLLGSIRERMFW